MSQYSEFFFNSSAATAELELVEISHPSFTETFYLVRNMVEGVTVTLETGVVQYFEFYPMKITPTGANSDLDQTLQVAFGDLGEILPDQLDAIQIAGTFPTKPVLLYRTYSSDNLAAPMQGPVRFQVNSIAFTKPGATLNCGAPSLNLNKTGESYNMDRFTALRSI